MNDTIQRLADKQWPKIFEDATLIDTLSERELCTQMFCAWALCHLVPAPENFGQIMVAAGERLGAVPSESGLTEYAKSKGWLT